MKKQLTKFQRKILEGEKDSIKVFRKRKIRKQMRGGLGKKERRKNDRVLKQSRNNKSKNEKISY